MTLTSTPLPVFKIVKNPKKTTPIKFSEFTINTYDTLFVKLKADYYIPITALFNLLVGDLNNYKWALGIDKLTKTIVVRLKNKNLENVDAKFAGFTSDNPLYSDVFLYGFLAELLGSGEEYMDYLQGKEFLTSFGWKSNPLKLLRKYFEDEDANPFTWFHEQQFLNDFVKTFGVLHTSHFFKVRGVTRLIEVPVHVDDGFDKFSSIIPIILNNPWVLPHYNSFKNLTAMFLSMVSVSPETIPYLAGDTEFYINIQRPISNVKTSKNGITTKIQFTRPRWMYIVADVESNFEKQLRHPKLSKNSKL